MKALVYGVESEKQSVSDDANELVRGLASTPMNLQTVDDPGLLGPDWAVVESRLTGICGSDSKQVFSDFGNSFESPMISLTSFPQILGHEYVGTVALLGPQASGLELGQRVVLNPWLSCGPRGIEPPCVFCRAGDLSLCASFQQGRLANGIHSGTSSDGTGGFAERLPAHDSMLFAVPDGMSDEAAVLADPFAVSLHSITRNPPLPGSKVLVYGAGALGSTHIAILRALFADVEVGVVARFPAQIEFAHELGAARVFTDPFDRGQLIEDVCDWSGGQLLAVPRGLPMAFPGGIDVVYDTIGKAETLEVGCRVVRSRGTLVQAGVHGAERWEATPLYFKEIRLVGSNAFGVEEVEGVRKHGIQHYLDLADSGRIDLSGLLTHTFRLNEWREAFGVLADQGESGAMKVAFDFR
ncbi:MAG: alcohol dehydrogenase catalytic domain-containing protein [Myxococcota bacterium]|nr:alcohol dehydrogenase catalytic domain-containing protein [Myxococcota bacterium]MEE2673979.1 alcohol dehydrogenase catalytic domain-containing protein [Myxococcota bacterium]